MRKELKIIGSKERHVFTATFIRFGFRDGYKGPVKTILLQDVLLDGKIVTDHLWFDLTKGFESADLLPGDVVEFCARVSVYEKGYKGYRNDVFDRPIEKDYRLSRPTKIKKIGKKYKEEKPPEGEEVLAYHPSWIDEDFNPRGIRIGFWNGGDDFKSAHWWDYQDCYITISHCDCDDNSLFSDRIKNSIEPELWISLDAITNCLPDIKQNHLSQ